MNYKLGVDLGGTNIALGIVDNEYNIIETHNVPTLKHRSFEEIVADMGTATRDIIAKAGLSLDDFTSIGIGAPSSLDPVTKYLAFANNLGWTNVPLIDEFQKHIDKPVFLANDADCAALGESIAGAAKNYNSVLMLTLGTGVGGGVILNGQIFTGGDGTGCELGHSTLVLDGFPCTCGRLGCLEAYASVTGLIRQTIEMIGAYPYTIMREICGNDLSKISGRTAFQAAKQGDEAGRRVVERYIYYVAGGISSLVPAFRPRAVIIGGGISNEGEYLLGPVREIVEDTLYAKGMIKAPDIMKASLGNAAGIIGAAFLETQN